MPRIPNSLRGFQAWFIILIAAIAIVGASYLLLPDWLQPLVWTISIVVTAIATFLLREFFPENARDRIRYNSNRVKKYWDNPNVHLSVAVRYSLSDSVALSELSEDVQSDLGSSPSGESRFEVSQKTDSGRVNKIINLDIDRSGSGHSSLMQRELQQETRTVSDIRVELTTETDYKNLKNMLIDVFEEESQVRSTFSPYGIQRGGYEIVCELDEPILLRKFMSKFDMDSIQATTEEGIDIEFKEKEIRVRNPGGGQLSATFDKVVKIVTYYG